MPEKLTVATIDADEELRALLRGNPDQLELVAEARDREDWHNTIAKSNPDILMAEINPMGDYGKTLKVIEKVKIEFPELAVFMTSASKSPDLIISAMRTGAQEFLSKPFNTAEFNRALDRVRRKKEQARARHSHAGRVITVFSKKGGVGVTTLAVNLAVALSQVSGKKVAILDLDLQLGDVSSFLDLSPRYNIIDACGRDGGVDDSKLQSCMAHHPSGVFVLAEPEHPAESDDISSAQVSQILSHLRATYPYVIIDTSHFFDQRILGALEMSDNIILTVVPNIASVRAGKKVLDLFKELGYGQEKVKVVVNRVSKHDSIKTDNIQKVFDYPICWNVPNNYPAVIDSINSGIPLIGQKRLSNVGKSILDLAGTVVNWNHVGVDAQTVI